MGVYSPRQWRRRYYSGYPSRVLLTPGRPCLSCACSGRFPKGSFSPAIFSFFFSLLYSLTLTHTHTPKENESRRASLLHDHHSHTRTRAGDAYEVHHVGGDCANSCVLRADFLIFSPFVSISLYIYDRSTRSRITHD